MFVWRDFKAGGKFKREKWRDNIFSSCLIGKGEGKKSGGAQVFTPHHFFFYDDVCQQDFYIYIYIYILPFFGQKWEIKILI